MRTIFTFLFFTLAYASGSVNTSPITVTGEARIPVMLNPVRAERLAQDMAQRDAQRKILLTAYGKPVPQGARLTGELRHVTFSPPERFEKEGRSMFRINAQIKPADVLNVRIVVDDRVDVRLDDIVSGLLENHPPLLSGGAHIFWKLVHCRSRRNSDGARRGHSHGTTCRSGRSHSSPRSRNGTRMA